MEADALSRIQQEDPFVVKAVLQRGKNIDTAIPEPFEMTILAKNVQLAGAPKISNQDWQKEQSEDIGCSESDKQVNLMIVIDHFTRYTQAYITPNQTAPVVAKTLWEHFLTHYGWPTNILTDQGKSFENNLFRELCALA